MRHTVRVGERGGVARGILAALIVSLLLAGCHESASAGRGAVTESDLPESVETSAQTRGNDHASVESEKPDAAMKPARVAAGRILLSSPRLRTVENLARLFEQGFFDADRVVVTGLYPESKKKDYVSVVRYIKKHKLKWLDLEAVSCQVPPDRLRTTNDCTGYFRDAFLSSSAVIFAGGPDIPGSFFGKPTSLTAEVTDPERNAFEISFLYHLLVNGGGADGKPLLDTRPDYPILGLCLGMQSMNVALGGTLVQDIPGELYGAKSVEDAARMPVTHRNYRHALDPDREPRWWSVHEILMTGRSFYGASIPARPPRVLSNHHQSLERVAPGLEVLATSPDGRVIEAVGHKSYPNVFGIQFHAEYKAVWDDPPATPDDMTLRDEDRAFHRAFWEAFAKTVR